MGTLRDILNIQQNLNSTIQIPGFSIPGMFHTYGNNADGDILYFEQRALITSVTDLGSGVFRVTAQAIFGGANTFDISIVEGPTEI